jgi:hypothetical protein
MEAKIFDRETMLDLVVNFIPLGIILFFIALFVVVTPWGFNIRTSGVMLGLMVVPFVALAILTYISAKAIAGDEKTKPVYAQGQAGLAEAEPKHHGDDDHTPEETTNAVDEAAGGDDDEAADHNDGDGENETVDKRDNDDTADGDTDESTA